MIELDLAFLAFLLGTAIPVVVALVTARVAGSGLKGFLNAVLALATGVLTAAQTTDGVLTKQAVVAAFYAWAASQAAHYGLLKPAGITGGDGAIQRAIPRGVGGPAVR